jgi:hypothetical protein
MTEKEEATYRPGWNWAGRSLPNYKAMHASLAKSKGVSKEFEAARTLTQARKILFGYKKGQAR